MTVPSPNLHYYYKACSHIGKFPVNYAATFLSWHSTRSSLLATSFVTGSSPETSGGALLSASLHSLWHVHSEWEREIQRERERERERGGEKEREREQLDRASDWHLAKSKCFQKESDSAPFQKYVFQVRFRSLAMFKYYRSKGSNNSFGQPRIYRTRLYYHIEFNIVKCSTRSVWLMHAYPPRPLSYPTLTE